MIKTYMKAANSFVNDIADNVNGVIEIDVNLSCAGYYKLHIRVETDGAKLEESYQYEDVGLETTFYLSDTIQGKTRSHYRFGGFIYG